MFGNMKQETATEQGAHHEITIDALGRATIEGKGFSGSACGLMGEALRRAIGGTRSDDDSKKPEFYQTGTQDQTQNW